MKKAFFALATLLICLNANAGASGSNYLVIAEESKSTYSRSEFKHWSDLDNDKCDTRAEVLLQEAVIEPKVGKNCKLSGGRWVSMYDGKVFTDASKLDVDHLVPLAEAWRSGASEWSLKLREEFANDLDENLALNAVSASSNRQKGDKDIAKWLPSKNLCI